MPLKHRLIRFYTLFYFLIILIAIIGLIINNKTMALNEKIQKITSKLDRVNEENNQLNLHILSQNSLQSLDFHAEAMGMIPTQAIILPNIK